LNGMVTQTETNSDSERYFSTNTESDIRDAIVSCRQLARSLGFRQAQATMVATALSELARNCLYHAGGGQIYIRILHKENRVGIGIEALDHGPGIADIDLAMQDYYSTRGTLGVGLPAAKRLMDSIEIESTLGLGTRVRANKWL